MIGEADLARAIERIVALYAPERVYVFGSYAKGTLKESSDLDLVVVKKTTVPRRQRGKDVVALLRELAVDFDLLFVTPDELTAELNEPHSLLSTVMSSARVVYELQP